MSKEKQLSAGRELDAAVARAMGVEPHRNWKASLDDDSVYMFVNSKEWALEEAADMERVHGQPSKVMQMEHFHEYSTDPTACALAKKWLVAHDCEQLTTYWAAWEEEPDVFHAEFDPCGGDTIHEFGSTEEEAIARLVLAVAGAK